ncbi:Ribosomal RNA small subunit methyltransferase I [Buchnera aphidicola (Eriosoma lanigerum)]|uniref:16S rRNA (cytidine(1402)-2'-O)-methyltransferase n=1 Tax=Buchnera aphidicola TaxID=9 RepID=UPI003464571D
MNNKTIKQKKTGLVYIVPTPIGNLSDITHRALSILNEVDLIAAENIIHTSQLLKHFNIKKYLTSLNQHNELKKTIYLINKIETGKNIALVSNAGTPIINDPGFNLIKACQNKHIRIIPLPGACSIITALIGSGLPANKFCYEGFLPTKKNDRCNLLKLIKKEHRTIIFFETSHRIILSIKDIINELGSDRNIVITRELTKYWESIYRTNASNMLQLLQSNPDYCKGEMIILIEGYKEVLLETIQKKHINTFLLLNQTLSLKQSTILTSKIHGIKKKIIYQYAINQLKYDKKNK